MLPFIGYNMSDYFAHWIAMGERITSLGAKAPNIFCVNWFRTDASGKFIWPGFGENMRVLKWMMDRIAGNADSQEHIFGYTPAYQHIHWEGLKLSENDYQQITAIDIPAWKAELSLYAELFEKLSHRLPTELEQTRQRLLATLTAKFFTSISLRIVRWFYYC